MGWVLNPIWGLEDYSDVPFVNLYYYGAFALVVII